MKLKHALWGFLALVATAASAKEITFEFRVNSSGPMIYACNAGLIHETTTQQICHRADLPPNDPAYNCNPGEHNCECTGANGGAYLMDYMKYKSRPWIYQTGSWGALSSGQKTAGGNSMGSNTATYSRVVDYRANGNLNPFENILSEVTFNLGSERYGACYHVDICYRGSQIEYAEDDVRTNVSLFANATITDIAGPTGTDLSYKMLAQPKVRAIVQCDQQGAGKGANVYARNKFGFYNTLVNDINWLSLDNRSSSATDQTIKSSDTYFTADTASIFDQWLIQNSLNFPRFCVVRYEFCESSLNERKWQRHDARFVLKTKIEEPPAE